MRIIKMPSYQGALEKSKGLEVGPDTIIDNIKILKNKVISLGKFSDINKQHDYNYKILIKNIKKGDIFLGGDHSITYSIFKAYKKKYPNLSLVIFDCHSDLHVLFDFVSHQDWLYYIIEEKVLSPKDVFVFGLRDISSQEKKYILDKKIQTLKYSLDLHKNIYKFKDFLKNHKNVYLSFDIDVLSPKIAPGTGYIKKGGISEKQALEFIRIVKDNCNIIGFDLVEVNPILDKNNKTVNLACRLIKEMIGN